MKTVLGDKKIDERTFEFALKIVQAYKFLVDRKEFVLSKQLLRAGTEIGCRMSDVGCRMSDVGCRKSEVGSRKSEVGSRRSEVGKGLKATEYQLTVMTYNVGTLHGTKVAFREIVNAVEEGGVPDLLLLQEIPNEEMVVGKDSGRWSVVRCQGFRERAVSGGRVNGC